MNGRRFTLFSLIAILALMRAGVPMRSAQAVSLTVVISQVYGGGGNSGAPLTNDFIELFNRGNTTVSVDGWSVQYTSATGTGNFGSAANLITLLSGSLAPGQYLLVQEASNAAVGSPLPTPDVTDATPINMAATGGKVALVNTTTPLGCNGGSTACSPAALATIVDLIGWDGANFFEGSAGPTTSNTTAALRAVGGCTDTDNNAADFAVGTPSPRNMASSLSPCQAGDQPPTVTSTFPVNGATDFPVNANLTVTFSEPVNVTASWFQLSCSVSGLVTAQVSGGPTVFTLDPAVTLTHGETCNLTVYADQVSDQDTDDPPDHLAANFTAVFMPFDACAAPYTHTFTIQGSGLSTPIPGPVTTKGVVVGDFEGSGGLQGFYLQDLAGDGDPTTSDGIFVFTGSANTVNAGQVVRVTGDTLNFFLTLDQPSGPLDNKCGPSQDMECRGADADQPDEVHAAAHETPGCTGRLERRHSRSQRIGEYARCGTSGGSRQRNSRWAQRNAGCWTL